MKVSPNPSAHGMWNFTFDEKLRHKSNVVLYDYAGRRVYDEVLPANIDEFLIDNSALNVGIYFINVQSGAQQFRSKLIKLNE